MKNPIPILLTFFGTVIFTVLTLWYYGYLHFATNEDSRLLAEFTMLKTIPGEDVKLSLAPADQVAQCIDGVLVLFNLKQKGLSGVLVDDKRRAVRCAGEETPQELIHRP